MNCDFKQKDTYVRSQRCKGANTKGRRVKAATRKDPTHPAPRGSQANPQPSRRAQRPSSPGGRPRGRSLPSDAPPEVADPEAWPIHEARVSRSKGKAAPPGSGRIAVRCRPNRQGRLRAGSAPSLRSAQSRSPNSPLLELHPHEPQPSPGSRAGTPPSPPLHPGPEGQRHRALPARTPRARPPAGGRTAPASRESTHSSVPTPHPAHAPPSPSPLRVVPPNTSSPPRPSPQDRAPQPYPEPSRHTPSIDNSDSSRLGDSDGRQRVRDTFATAVKESRVGAAGGGSARGAGLAARARAAGPAPSPSCPQAPDPAARLGGRTQRGRRGGGAERPQRPQGCVSEGRAAGKGTPRGDPRGGRAGRVPARGAPGNDSDRRARGPERAAGGLRGCVRAGPRSSGPTVRSRSQVSPPPFPPSPPPRAKLRLPHPFPAPGEAQPWSASKCPRLRKAAVVETCSSLVSFVSCGDRNLGPRPAKNWSICVPVVAPGLRFQAGRCGRGAGVEWRPVVSRCVYAALGAAPRSPILGRGEPNTDR